MFATKARPFLFTEYLPFFNEQNGKEWKGTHTANISSMNRTEQNRQNRTEQNRKEKNRKDRTEKNRKDRTEQKRQNRTEKTEQNRTEKTEQNRKEQKRKDGASHNVPEFDTPLPICTRTKSGQLPHRPAPTPHT